MKIGIDASRSFRLQRTGIEEYSYQIIMHLRKELRTDEVLLYIRKNQKVNFDLPTNWKIKVIRWPRFWTQIGLSLEMMLHPVDVLFIPAHIVPIIHPRNTLVTVHGLEYEMMPEAYSFWGRFYMKISIKKSCQWAKKIIAVSENTKGDLMRLYNVSEDKIKVIGEGVSENFKFKILNLKSNLNDKILIYKPYLLYIGRLEERKNVAGILETFKILKEKYKIPHSLVLAGAPGYGYESIKYHVSSIKYQEDIILTGFISEEEKWQLLSNADVFLFPSFYEGFGLPVLEAQSVGVPVVTSSVSSLPEVAGVGAAYCDPHDPNAIVEATYRLISDESYKNAIIEKGHENANGFSWERCADSIAKLLNS